jgi:hypothetical protein
MVVTYGTVRSQTGRSSKMGRVCCFDQQEGIRALFDRKNCACKLYVPQIKIARLEGVICLSSEVIDFFSIVYY